MTELDTDVSTTRVPGAANLISVLRSRAPRTALALAAVEALRPAIKRAYAWAENQTTYTVKVPGQDLMYGPAHRWLRGLIPESEQRALVAFSDRTTVSGTSKYAVELQHDGAQQVTVSYLGHRLRVAVTEARLETETRDGGVWKPPELVITARSEEARDAVIEKLQEIVSTVGESKRTPGLKVFGEYGWEVLQDTVLRPVSSVTLPHGQADRIIQDVQAFLDAESEYYRRGLPYHRGYLFEGPPRTGKTSFAQALAGHFGMDLWYLPLGDVKRDGDLLRKISGVSPRSVLLIEDVDIFSAATSRDDADGARATLAGLLNALDGAATPHALITILTSNRPGKLDDALVQPGRIDRVEHFGLCTKTQGMNIIRHYFDDDIIETRFLDLNVITGSAPAQVMEACKRSTSGRGAIIELADMRGMEAIVPRMVDVPVEGELL